MFSPEIRKYGIFVAKICKYGIFVTKICKYGIFVAEICKYGIFVTKICQSVGYTFGFSHSAWVNTLTHLPNPPTLHLQTKCYLCLPKISDLPLQLNSCWNNHPFLHLDAISDLVSMTELFLPARQGFTCPTHRPRPAPCEHNNQHNPHCKSIPRANMWTFLYYGVTMCTCCHLYTSVIFSYISQLCGNSVKKLHCHELIISHWYKHNRINANVQIMR